MYFARSTGSSAEVAVPLPERSALFSVLGPDDILPLAADSSHAVVCAEETGGTNALMPVLRELHLRNIGATAVAAGNGLQILQERGHEHGLRLSEPLDEWPETALRPGALLITPSEDGRLEQDLLSRFPFAPAIVIEDYYESSRRSVEAAAKMGLPLPTVCVIDQEAERLIRRRFPGLPVPVEITGSPTFDTLAGEDASAVQAQSRAELGVPPDKKFIAFLIPRLGRASLQLAQQVADAFRQMDSEYIFAPRRHPSDTIERIEYERLFDGVPTLDTVGIPTDKVSNAADLVIAQRSVTVLREAVRQRPTITLNMGIAPGFTFPVVDAGASLPAQPSELPKVIPELLQGMSGRCEELRRNMLQLRTDGRAAARVADVVFRALGLF